MTVMEWNTDLCRRTGVLAFPLVLQAPLLPVPSLPRGSRPLPLSQVEEVIDPQFLQQLNSPDAQLDPLALAEKLEQEEGLTAAQVSQGRVGL